MLAWKRFFLKRDYTAVAPSGRHALVNIRKLWCYKLSMKLAKWHICVGPGVYNSDSQIGSLAKPIVCNNRLPVVKKMCYK